MSRAAGRSVRLRRPESRGIPDRGNNAGAMDTALAVSYSRATCKVRTRSDISFYRS
jgi:hypothetical protein